jgi:hypothetical protein
MAVTTTSTVPLLSHWQAHVVPILVVFLLGLRAYVPREERSGRFGDGHLIRLSDEPLGLG